MNKDFPHTVKRLRTQLLLIARHILGDEDEAEDVVQDALLKLWQLKDEPVRNVDAFAKVMVRNLCIDRVRRRCNMVDVDEYDVADPPPETESDALIERMLALVDKLPTMQQTILKMRHIDGMEMSDIASLIGTSEVAVRQSLSRARRKVFEQMTKGDSAL